VPPKMSGNHAIDVSGALIFKVKKHAFRVSVQKLVEIGAKLV